MDFDHATDADRARAKALAEAAGWRQQGFRYVHPTRGNYLTKDMDGWIDLCDNEGIDWVAPSDAVNASAEARLREALEAARDYIGHDNNPKSSRVMEKIMKALSAGGDEAKKSEGGQLRDPSNAPSAFEVVRDHYDVLGDPTGHVDTPRPSDPSAERREIVARIIDPDAYETINEARWEGLARLESQAEAQLRAERKADTILAALGGR